MTMSPHFFSHYNIVMGQSNKTKKDTKIKKRIFSKKHYLSGDGMMTLIWGPNLWHYLHTISFNYPVKPYFRE